jgi:hypothetical protein
MRSLWLGFVGLLAIGAASPAAAADLAARPYTKAPPMIATIYDWKAAMTPPAVWSAARSAIAGRARAGCSASKARVTGPI